MIRMTKITKNNFKRGGKKSNKPYIIEIPKFKENELLINDEKMFDSKKDLSPLSGAEYKYEPEKWNDDDNIKKSIDTAANENVQGAKELKEFYLHENCNLKTVTYALNKPTFLMIKFIYVLL